MSNTLIFLLLIGLFLFIIWRIQRKKLAEYHSKLLGLIEVWEKYDGEKVLTINKYPHGISVAKKSLVKSYWYKIADEVLTYIYKKQNPHVLFFGLGANTSSYIIHQKNPKVRQTIIEIDSFIIQACKEFFRLDEMKNVRVIQGDAYRLVDTKPDFNNTFDVVIVDIFTGIPPFVSSTTNKPSFIQKAKKWLKKDGVILFNRPANIAKDRKDTEKLVVYLQSLFKEVTSIYIRDPRGYKNDIVIATINL